MLSSLPTDQHGFLRMCFKLILAQKQPNFNAKMFSIENIPQRLRAEFADKNALLRATYREIPAFDFYSYLYQSDQAPKIYAIDGKTYRSAAPDDLPMIAAFRADLYIPPCDFFGGVYRQAMLAKIFALVLDIDDMDPDTLGRLLDRINSRELPQPSLIVNSGSGVHLYFAFSAPVDTLKRRLPALRGMLAKLADVFTGYGRMDRHPLTQSFRPVGSQTKLGDVATGFMTGDRWTVDQLAALCSVDLGGNFGPLDIIKDPPTPKPKKKKAANVLFMPNAKRKFFRYCAERVFKYTDLGSRYMALFGIAIVGYKTHTPREEVVKEMESLVKIWNRRHPEAPVEWREIDKAMDGYSQKFLMVRSATLEEYFGWSFERKIPRRGRTREEHLQRNNDRTVGEVRGKIKRYLVKHYAVSISQIARDLKMSRNTVAKYVCVEKGLVVMKI